MCVEVFTTVKVLHYSHLNLAAKLSFFLSPPKNCKTSKLWSNLFPMATLGIELKLMMHCREVTFSGSIHKRCNVTLVFGWGMVTPFLFMLKMTILCPFSPYCHIMPLQWFLITIPQVAFVERFDCTCLTLSHSGFTNLSWQ